MAASNGNPLVLTVDIAFDWDSKAKESQYDGFCLCGASGFDLQVAGNPPAGVRGLIPGNQLQFAVYDISDQEDDRSVSALVIKLRSAHLANTAEYPFDPSVMGPPDPQGWYPIAGLSIEEKATGGESGVYGGPFPLWTVVPRRLRIQTHGWYFFEASMTVTSSSGSTKTFGNDPELIVRPAG